MPLLHKQKLPVWETLGQHSSEAGGTNTEKTREQQQQHFNSLPGRVNIDWLRGKSQLILLFGGTEEEPSQSQQQHKARGNHSANISGRWHRVMALVTSQRLQRGAPNIQGIPGAGKWVPHSPGGRREHRMLQQSRKPSPAPPGEMLDTPCPLPSRSPLKSQQESALEPKAGTTQTPLKI